MDIVDVFVRWRANDRIDHLERKSLQDFSIVAGMVLGWVGLNFGRFCD